MKCCIKTARPILNHLLTFVDYIPLANFRSNILWCDAYNWSFFTFRKSGGDFGERVLRSTPDWGETAVIGDHLWMPTSVSGDFCYVGDVDCTVRNATSVFVCNTYWNYGVLLLESGSWFVSMLLSSGVTCLVLFIRGRRKLIIT